MQKILLAEDDPNLGELLKDYLELKGKFEVTLCRDGEEALSSFHRQLYDLCILDVMMPKKDGFSLGRDIRRTDSSVPIIFATAKEMMEDKTQAFELGGDDYITKPFRVEERKTLQPNSSSAVFSSITPGRRSPSRGRNRNCPPKRPTCCACSA